MQEKIVIFHNSFADPARVAAFRDSLLELLAEEGSQATISSNKVRPFQLDGQQFRVVWKGNYEFQSPDGHYSFGDDALSVTIGTTDLSFETYQKLIAARSRALAKAYRDALEKVLSMSIELALNHQHVSRMSPTEYIRETLQAAVDALPNHH